MAKDVMAPNPEVSWGKPNTAQPGKSQKVNSAFSESSFAAAKTAVERLKSNFESIVLAEREFSDELRVEVNPEAIAEVLAFLRDDPELSFRLLSQVAGAEWYKPEQSPRRFFYVTYDLYSFDLKSRLFVYTVLPQNEPTVPTVSHLFSTAEWHEREIYDLFGINFEGHPDLRRILLPPDYDGHPLRKDYPARGKNVWNLEKNVIPAGLDEIIDGFGK